MSEQVLTITDKGVERIYQRRLIDILSSKERNIKKKNGRCFYKLTAFFMPEPNRSVFCFTKLNCNEKSRQTEKAARPY